MSTISKEKLEKFLESTWLRGMLFPTTDYNNTRELFNRMVALILGEADSGALSAPQVVGGELKGRILGWLPVRIKPEKNKPVLLAMVENNVVSRAERGYYTGTAGIFSVKFPVTHWAELLDLDFAEQMEALNTRPTATQGEMVGAIHKALRELGVPQPGYPAPVTNAVEILTAALSASPVAGWMPIETADALPKDGNHFLVIDTLNHGIPIVVVYFDSDFMECENGTWIEIESYTHYFVPPPQPTTAEEGEEQ